MTSKMKKIILVVIVVSLLIFGVPLIMGASAASYHESSVSAQIEKPIEKAWPLLINPQLAKEINSNVKSIEVLPRSKKGMLVWKESYGGDDYMILEVVEEVKHQKRVVEINETPMPFSGRWIFEVESPSDSSFTLKITEKAEVHNILFRFIYKYIWGYDFIIGQFLGEWKTYIEKNA